MGEFDKITQEVINQCKSYASLFRYIDIPMSGWSQQRLKEYIKSNNFNTDHFTGKGWKDGYIDYKRFRKGVSMKSANARNALTQLRGYECEMCGISKWEGTTIPLEVHHIDGDCLNNEMDNLMLLCPNCHSITKHWRNTDNSSKIKVTDEILIESIKATPNIRQALLKVGLSPKGGNYARVYELKAKYDL
jgi:5-methylcytosine-specific restriction endonuclease McrA